MTEKQKMEAKLWYDADYDKELLPQMEENCVVLSPVYADYGVYTKIGHDTFINHNAYLMDGGDVTILPGVTIGNNTIIGAGSVVTKDIPDHVVAVGNPCRVLRPITEEDRIDGKGHRYEVLF